MTFKYTLQSYCIIHFLFSRERANKKTLLVIVKEFSFICRGLILIDPENDQ